MGAGLWRMMGALMWVRGLWRMMGGSDVGADL